MPKNSIDIIITDPPYPIEHIDCWDKLGRISERVLKPSGFLIAYSGHIHLNKVLAILDGYLQYFWQFILLHTGHSQLVLARNTIATYKPLLIYQKPPYKKLKSPLKDCITGTGREKESHSWQQSEYEMCHIIREFTVEGDTILDPFMGSGTTGGAARDMRRDIIGIEINPDYCKIAEERLAQGVL